MSLIPRLVSSMRTPFSRVFEEMASEMQQMERAFFNPYLARSIGNPSEVVNDTNKFSISLDVAQFKPEELKINLEGHTLVVEGSQETKDDNGYFKRSFSRRFLLPDDVAVADLKSTLTDTGRLSIEAPKKEPVVTNIPISNVQEKKE